MGSLIPIVQQELSARKLKTGLVGVDSAGGAHRGVLTRMPSSTVRLLKEVHVHGYTWGRGKGLVSGCPGCEHACSFVHITAREGHVDVGVGAKSVYWE